MSRSNRKYIDPKDQYLYNISNTLYIGFHSQRIYTYSDHNCLSLGRNIRALVSMCIGVHWLLECNLMNIVGMYPMKCIVGRIKLMDNNALIKGCNFENMSDRFLVDSCNLNRIGAHNGFVAKLTKFNTECSIRFGISNRNLSTFCIAHLSKAYLGYSWCRRHQHHPY